jgi:DNA ligase D-like protein (predicted 3'-phosphoesterase)
MPEPLQAYRRRRASGSTPEPMGGRSRRDGPIFVVQEHKATSHHFDFRIEVDGVLKSWAVPKGPSTDPRDKRLAMPTEDHPLDYADFEGVIPADSYGAGAVIVWDRGRYDNITEKGGEVQPISAALEAGHALIRLHGKKLQGGYVLQRVADAADPRWLLIKMKGEGADARRRPVSTEPESVLSGRTIDALEPARDASRAREES